MFILASSSPRRKELLKKLIDEFTVVFPNIDESLIHDVVSPYRLPLEESRAKAYSIYLSHPNDQVLACDTIVFIDNKVLGKPLDEEDAIRMLKEESGKKQIVLSGYTYIDKTREISRIVRSEVYFNTLSEEEIRAYVKKYQPLDKAGAYGVQDPVNLIKSIEGSYYNVMGLPVEDIAKHVFNR